jgi:hypothetical protein
MLIIKFFKLRNHNRLYNITVKYQVMNNLILNYVFILIKKFFNENINSIYLYRGL